MYKNFAHRQGKKHEIYYIEQCEQRTLFSLFFYYKLFYNIRIAREISLLQSEISQSSTSRQQFYSSEYIFVYITKT